MASNKSLINNFINDFFRTCMFLVSFRGGKVIFKKIDLYKHENLVVKFREDSFKASFGNTNNFNAKEYLSWLEEKIKVFPRGYVLVELDNQYIGQIELSIREYQGKNIGYVHLYYLIPDMRGKGIARELHNYAMKFFEEHNVIEYHLRVSPTNESAIQFYQKLGLKEVGLEVEGQVLRMKGLINYENK